MTDPSSTTPRRGALSEPDVDTALRRSVKEGALYALMVGIGETYFVALAIRLGATPLELGLVVALPLLLGSLGTTAAVRLLRHWPRRRPIVVAFAAGQVGVLAALALGAWLGHLTVTSLIAALCVFQFCGQGAGTAWSSWYGDLVPARIRGTWFARRTRLVHLATFAGLLLGGLALHLMQPSVTAEEGGSNHGFAAILVAAALCRAVSVAVLQSSPEPTFRGLASGRQLLRFVATRRGRNAVRLMLGGASFYVAVYLSSPYFTPFMLEELGIGYSGYTAVVATQVASKFMTMPYWGRLVDRFGARHAWGAAILMAALVPLPWLWVSGLGGVLFAQFVSGIAWGGYEVALLALLLHSTTAGSRPSVFAAQSVCNAIGQTCGSLAGAAILGGGSAYAWVFGISLVARLVIALVLPRGVSDLRPAGAPRREPLLLRIIGVRPGSGVVHRPMLVPPGAEGDDAEEVVVDDGGDPSSPS
ncbi:MAG: MFS transporter [Planctomycetes bacterium]|nr:MFS transporter [Planctomycetota bacterium]